MPLLEVYVAALRILARQILAQKNLSASFQGLAGGLSPN